MPDPTDVLAKLPRRPRPPDCGRGPPTPTQLAAQVALMEAVLVTLDDISPNQDALQRWLQVAGVHDRPVSFRYGQWAVQTAP